MKNTTRYLVLLSVLAVGCGNTDTSGDEDDGGDTALQCTAVGWCTTWNADGEEVTDAPPLNGGTIRDGIYRLEQGTPDRQAMVFQGNSVLFVDGFWSNQKGTWKASGGKLDITLATYCDSSDDGTLSGTFPYAFAVRGDELFTQDLEHTGSPILRWKRVSALCDESTSFKCRVRNCACSATTNKPLKGQPDCS